MRSAGHGRRLRPRKLKDKLRMIRQHLDVTQEEIVKRLRPLAGGSPIYPGHISEFENGKRELSLLVLLAYARIADMSTDALIDDEMDLPKKLSSQPQHSSKLKRVRR